MTMSKPEIHHEAPGWAAKLCAMARLMGFLGLTLPLMPVQGLLLMTKSQYAKALPVWYHRNLCRLLGIRIHTKGNLTPGRAALIVANHSSWLDIPVISAVGPLSFVAKHEVRGWPLVASLARLQRTVFVDRARRQSAGQTANEIIGRLAQGDNVVLFAEGTSSDGNRLLNFKTSLFAAAKPTRGVDAEPAGAALVQSLTVAYTHLHGVPLSRAERAQLTGWYGEMGLVSHAWSLLQAGPIDVHIHIGTPRRLDEFKDRKHLAQETEIEIRETLVGLLRRNGHLEGPPTQ